MDMQEQLIKVLVVEDEPLVRSLLASLLELQGFELRLAADAADARHATRDFEPDVAILDIELGSGPSGVDLAHILRVQFPNVGLVFLTHIPEPRVVGIENRNLPKKAVYLRKDCIADSKLLKNVIETSFNGRGSKDLRDDRRLPHPLAGVSRSQLDVLRLVATGCSNQEIAAKRGTTLRAVEHLVKRAFTAAGIDSSPHGNTRVLATREFIRVAGMPHAKLGETKSTQFRTS